MWVRVDGARSNAGLVDQCYCGLVDMNLNLSPLRNGQCLRCTRFS